MIAVPSTFARAFLHCGAILLFFFTLPAATPPAASLAVSALSFAPGSTLTVPPAIITITLSAPPDPISANSLSVTLVRAGPDHLLGTSDDVTVLPNSVSVSGSQILFDLTGLTLPNDTYRLTVRGNDLPIPGFAHWWKLDDGSGSSAADSMGSLTGTLGGGGGTSPTWTSGRLGGALSFAGADNRVLLGGTDLPTPWTAALWVNRTDSPRVDARLVDSNFNSLRLEQFSGTNEVGVTVYGSSDTAFSYTAPIGQWVHLAFVGESSGTSLYVNGVFVQKVATVLGCPLNALGSGGFNSMTGLLDDVRIYSRNLSPDEVAALAGLGGAVRDTSGIVLDGEYSGSFPSGDGMAGGDFVVDFSLAAAPPRLSSMTPAPGSIVASASSVTLVADGPLDPATVTDATASITRAGPDGLLGTPDDVAVTPVSVALSGGSSIVIGLPPGLPADLYQVRLSGTSSLPPGPVNAWHLDEGMGTTAGDSTGSLNGTLGGGGSIIPLWTNGKVGTGLRFQASDDRVTLGGVDLPGPWTTLLWVYRRNSAHEDSRLLDSNFYSLRLEQYNFTKKVGVTIYGSTDAPFSYIAPMGQWTHLAFVGTSGGTSLYVNGVFSESIGTVVSVPRNTLGSGGYNSMAGLLDEVLVYNSAFSPDQIKQTAALGGAVRSTGTLLLDGEFGGSFPSGDGTAGGDFVATFTLSTSPPPPPTGLSALVGTGQVSLSWTASPGTTSYIVKRATASGAETPLATGLVAPGYVDSSVTGGVIYFYVVTAVGPGGESLPSNEVSAVSVPAASGVVNLTAAGCGLAGIELLAPLGLWLTWRRLRRKARSPVLSILSAMLLALLNASALQAQDPKPPTPPPAQENPSPKQELPKSAEPAPPEKPAAPVEEHPLPKTLAEDADGKETIYIEARGGAWSHPTFEAVTVQGLRKVESGWLPEGGLDLRAQFGAWFLRASADYAAGKNLSVWIGGASFGLTEPLPTEEIIPLPLLMDLSVGPIGGHLDVELPGFGSFKSAWGVQIRGEVRTPLGAGKQLSFWADFRSISFEYEEPVVSGDKKAFGSTVALGGALTIGF